MNKWTLVDPEKNKKRDISSRNWYQSTNDRFSDAVDEKNRDNPPRRGDIPILHGDCDGNFSRTFSLIFIKFNLQKKYFLFLSIPLTRPKYYVNFIRSFPTFIDIMSKAIQDLLALVKLLREEVAHQTNEINHLRRLIENCAGCRETTPIVRENCDNLNPCFEGVQCHESANGVRCGRCPTGM